MNKVLIAGRISRKGVLSYSSNGTAYLDIIIAIPGRENIKRTEYLSILLKGNAAENAENLAAGRDVEIEGYLQMETSIGKDAKPFENIKLFGEKITEIPRFAGDDILKGVH